MSAHDAAGRLAPNPARFTLRELMLLVVSEKEPSDRRRYLELTYGWYYDRSRTVRAVVAACILAVGIAAADTPLEPWEIRVVVVSILAFAAGYALVGRVQLSPLHREHLGCLALLRSLQRFEAALTIALDEHPDRLPEPGVYGRATLRSRRVARKMVHRIRLPADAGVQAWDPEADPDRSEWNGKIGLYLLGFLGAVPTDDYERRPCVRARVDCCIRRAAALGRLPDRPEEEETARCHCR